MQTKAQFPEKLEFLFTHYRYKVARGGRGSAKSWSFARALLIQGLKTPLRILCAREVQLSIRQSVHKLLKDQIDRLGLESYYQVYESEIRGINGTEFAFVGLSTLTVDQIKSFEGIDICWVEEGQTISKRSWEILIPTIRKEGSEIWVSYNPDLESDETHQRFTVNPPPDCFNVEVNWRDNPWFNDVLNQERLHCKAVNSEDYDNIWEGKCRSAVEGAIYHKQITDSETHGRICNVPYDPMLRVQVVMDLGSTQTMAIGMVQKHTSELRLIDYIEGGQEDLSGYSALLKERKYNWGRVYLPHDGFAKSVNSPKSSAAILRALGWDVPERVEIVELSVEEGIKQAQLTFPRLYFDKVKTAVLVESLRRYRRHLNRQTDSFGAPVGDQFSHGADMLRYLCINADSMTNEQVTPVILEMPRFAQQPNAWML